MVDSPLFGLYVSGFVPNRDRECGRCRGPFVPCLFATALVDARISKRAV